MKDLTVFLDKQTNKQTNKTSALNKVFICAFVTFCCLSQVHAVSVRERMQNEVTSIKSLKSFYKTNYKPYDRRYTIQYLPQYLLKLNVQQTPDWVIEALDSALDDSYAPLAVAAMRCIGDLKLAAFADRLTSSFAKAPARNPASQYSARLAVLESMRKFDSTTVQEYLPALVDSYSEELIFSQVFEKLMETVVSYGQPALEEKVDRFETFAVNTLAQHENEMKLKKTVDKQNDPFYPEYSRVMQAIKRAKLSLAHKGGSHE
jgi:hypothetical protein